MNHLIDLFRQRHTRPWMIAAAASLAAVPLMIVSEVLDPSTTTLGEILTGLAAVATLVLALTAVASGVRSNRFLLERTLVAEENEATIASSWRRRRPAGDIHDTAALMIAMYGGDIREADLIPDDVFERLHNGGLVYTGRDASDEAVLALTDRGRARLHELLLRAHPAHDTAVDRILAEITATDDGVLATGGILYGASVFGMPQWVLVDGLLALDRLPTSYHTELALIGVRHGDRIWIVKDRHGPAPGWVTLAEWGKLTGDLDAASGPQPTRPDPVEHIRQG